MIILAMIDSKQRNVKYKQTNYGEGSAMIINTAVINPIYIYIN